MKLEFLVISFLDLFFILYTFRNIIVFLLNIKTKKDFVLKLDSIDIITYALYLVSIVSILKFSNN